MKYLERLIHKDKSLLLLSLVTILLFALLLRLWGIGFGLPYPYHVDEPTYISAALNLGAGNIGKQPNPTGYSNLLFLEYVFYYAVGSLSGFFSSLKMFELQYRYDPTIFYVLSRLTTVFFGVLNVLTVYLIGKELRDRLAGVISALIFSVTFLHVRDSHFGVPDIMMASLISLTILFCLYAVKRSKRNYSYLFLAAIFAGLATATKWTAVLLIFPIGITSILISPRKINRRSMIPIVAITLLLFSVGFTLGGFQVILQPRIYLNYALSEMQAGEAGGFGFWQIDNVPGWIFYIKTLLIGIGPGLLLFGVLGLLKLLRVAVLDRDNAITVLLVFPVTYFILMGSTRHYFARYVLPLIPFIIIFATEAMITMVVLVNNRRRKWVRALLIIIIIFTVVQPMINSLRFNYLLTQDDTRTIAKEWIENNITAGAKIAMDWPIHGPPIYPEDTMKVGEKTYAITFVGITGLSEHSIEWFQQQGYDYLIASSFIYEIPTVFEDQDEIRKAFYASLDENLELMKEFSPYRGSEPHVFIFDEIYSPAVNLWQRERPGPIIKIYRLPN